MTQAELKVAIDQYKTEAEAGGYKVVLVAPPREERLACESYFAPYEGPKFPVE